MLEAWKRLLSGRKFWLAVVALLQTAVFAFTDMPPVLWLSVDALLVAVIFTIAVEDAATKAAGKHKYQTPEGVVTQLMRSRKVWLAFVGVVQTFLFYFVPGFPQEVWLAANGVIVIVIGSIAVEDYAYKRHS